MKSVSLPDTIEFVWEVDVVDASEMEACSGLRRTGHQ